MPEIETGFSLRPKSGCYCPLNSGRGQCERIFTRIGPEIPHSAAAANLSLRTLLFEHGDLALVVGGTASWAAGGADYR